jgi:hypothetical protein
MKRHVLITFVVFLVSTFQAEAQVRFSGRIETGYQYFQHRTIIYEPEPGSVWKGYNLKEKQNGMNVTAVNGLTFIDGRLFTGIGLGYLNFEGIEGVSIYGDFEYLPLKYKLSPLVNLKLGYNHIWNQYEGGTGTMHTEFGIGLNYKLKEKFGLYVKAGVLMTQQSLLIPITLGFRY